MPSRRTPTVAPRKPARATSPSRKQRGNAHACVATSAVRANSIGGRQIIRAKSRIATKGLDGIESPAARTSVARVSRAAATALRVRAPKTTATASTATDARVATALSPRASGPRSTRTIILVLGGVASGKSAYAERLALDLAGGGASRRRPLYIATADRKLSWADPEMMRRIETHRVRRGQRWDLIETSTDLTGALRGAARDRRVALVDCLTLWLGNLMHDSRNVANQQARLIAALERATSPVVLVSDEVGFGGIADNELARAFADAQGSLNQAVARVATRVVLVAAGLPVTLKDVDGKDGTTTKPKDRR